MLTTLGGRRALCAVCEGKDTEVCAIFQIKKTASVALAAEWYATSTLLISRTNIHN